MTLEATLKYIDDLRTDAERLALGLDTLKGLLVECGPVPVPDPDPIPDPDPVPVPDPDPIPDPIPDPVPVPTPGTPPIVGGTVAKTTAELMALWQAAKPGDTIGVANGDFGSVTLSGKSGVSIVAENAHAAHFDRVTTKGLDQLGLYGLKVYPSGNVVRAKSHQFGIVGDATAKRVTVQGCLLQGRADVSNHHQWSKAEWQNAMQGAVLLDGDGAVLTDNVARGIHFGFLLTGDDATVTNVRVDGASGDGFRCGGSRHSYDQIAVTDLVLIDQNHPDCLQAFGKKSATGYELIDGLTIDRFVFLEWTHRSDNPLRNNYAQNNKPGIAQGLGMHNPPYANTKLSRGLVRTAVWNGVKGFGTVDMSDVHVWNGDRDLGLTTPLSDVKIDWRGDGSIKNCTADAFPNFGSADPSNGKPVANFVFSAWAKAMGF